MVFTLGLRQTFPVWQRGLALLQFPAVQTRSLRRSVLGGVVKTFRCPDEIIGVANLYESPTTETSLVDPPITDAIVRRLIDGTDTEKLVFYDVSDCQFYGRKHRRKLTGTLAAEAESAGCVPTVYQSVLWFCLVFVPVWPLGTYFIIPCDECDDPDGDADQYRGIRAKRDMSQVVIHSWPLVAHILVVYFAIWYWWR